MAKNQKKIVLTFNSPVILGFSALCAIAMVLNIVTLGASNTLLFSVYRSSLLNPLTYVRLFTHVLGHASWDHLIGNLMLLLIAGPMLEEKYGSKNILKVIIVTAFVTGLVDFIFFPGKAFLGASGVVFALILLTSFASINSGEIPITFILVALLYLGQQVYQGIFVQDNVSNLSHIIGGAIGSVLGFWMNSGKKR